MPSAGAPNTATPDLTSAVRDLVRYRQEHLTGDEKGEGQIFLEHLFQAFGHAGLREAGAVLEARMRRRSDKRRRTSFADCVWKPRVLIEMKKAREPLGRHYEQALEYWFRAVPDRPRYVVLCNFDEFWIYDFNHQIEEPVDRLRLEDLPRRWEALAFLLPEEMPSTFGNDLVAVTRESAARVSAVFNHMVDRGVDRQAAQRFVLQSVMAMALTHPRQPQLSELPGCFATDGKHHPHAIRILARAWLRVMWACWHTDTAYDPAKHGGEQRLAA